MPYCPRMARAVTLSMVVARPHRDGERDANLHARSARRAPRSGARGVRSSAAPPARDRSGSTPSSVDPWAPGGPLRRLGRTGPADRMSTRGDSTETPLPAASCLVPKGVRLEQLWYVVGFAFAGVSFVFLTIGAAWLVSHRNKGDVHKGLPYESGIDTYGDTHGRFGLSFYIYALLFVAFDIEVIFIYLWAIVFKDPSLNPAGLFISMVVFVLILLLGLAYAWRKGALTWR